MSYEPTLWSTGDIITADKLNKIENQLVLLTNDYKNKLITIFKTSETILLDWITTGEILQVRFYGATVDYIAVDRHGTTSVAGTTIDWMVRRYLCIDFTTPTQPLILYYDDINEIYANENIYIFAFMHYINGVENITIINNVSLPKPS